MGKFQYILRNLRTSNSLTQDELSKSLKISRSTIGMYEKGAREPDFETLESIADFFNVDIDYLLGRTDKTTFIPQSSPTSTYTIHCDTEAEGNLILTYRKLNDKNKQKCTAYTNTLLTTQEMEDELVLNAAHDNGATPEQKRHADDIMQDPNEWE